VKINIYEGQDWKFNREIQESYELSTRKKKETKKKNERQKRITPIIVPTKNRNGYLPSRLPVRDITT
jgi:hypothetical protein